MRSTFKSIARPGVGVASQYIGLASCYSLPAWLARSGPRGGQHATIFATLKDLHAIVTNYFLKFNIFSTQF